MSHVELHTPQCPRCGSPFLRWEINAINGVVIGQRWECDERGCTALRDGLRWLTDGDGIVSTQP